MFELIKNVINIAETHHHCFMAMIILYIPISDVSNIVYSVSTNITNAANTTNITNVNELILKLVY